MLASASSSEWKLWSDASDDWTSTSGVVVALTGAGSISESCSSSSSKETKYNLSRADSAGAVGGVSGENGSPC